MSFSTKNVEETVAEQKIYDKPYIDAGINEVTFVKIEGNPGQEGKSPFITIDFAKMSDNSKGVSEKLYFSEKAIESSLQKIKHMATKVVTVDKIDAINESDVVAYAAKLNSLLVGKSLRIKFSGEEIQGSEGKKNWTKAVFPYYVSGKTPPFAEDLKVKETKLTFDSNNKFDVKKLVAPTATTNLGPKDDLPF